MHRLNIYNRNNDIPTIIYNEKVIILPAYYQQAKPTALTSSLIPFIYSYLCILQNSLISRLSGVFLNQKPIRNSLHDLNPTFFPGLFWLAELLGVLIDRWLSTSKAQQASRADSSLRYGKWLIGCGLGGIYSNYVLEWWLADFLVYCWISTTYWRIVTNR